MKTLVVCTDERDGLSLFNKRLSSDKALYPWLAGLLGPGEKIHMEPYSAPLFDAVDSDVVDAREDWLEAPDGLFLLERGKVDQGVFDRIVLVRWNRRYPSDGKFKVDADLFCRTAQTEIAGHAHDRLTIETWERRIR